MCDAALLCNHHTAERIYIYIYIYYLFMYVKEIFEICASVDLPISLFVVNNIPVLTDSSGGSFN